MADNASKWNFPVSFYFLVDFQYTHDRGRKFHASFSEIEGIGWEIRKGSVASDSFPNLTVPDGITFHNIVLKRPLAPLSEDFTKWVDSCGRMMYYPKAGKGLLRKEVCDVIIKLLDESGKPVAAWTCNCAYPVKYTLGALKSDQSGLEMETIELAYNRLTRKNV